MDGFIARHRRQTTSSKVAGSVCDGCRSFEVITSGRKIIKERYYCNRQKKDVDPWDGCGWCVKPQK